MYSINELRPILTGCDTTKYSLYDQKHNKQYARQSTTNRWLIFVAKLNIFLKLSALFSTRYGN